MEIQMIPMDISKLNLIQMETKLIRIVLIFILIPFFIYSQELKYSKNIYIDSLLSYKLANKKRVIKYDEVEIVNFNINAVKLYTSLKELNIKFGKGELNTKKYMDNMDIDNPIAYEKKFLKVKNSFFQLDEKNRLIGAEIYDSIFVLSYNNIKIGDEVKQIFKKLPLSKNEINISGEKYSLLLKIKEVIPGCKKCSTNIVFYIDKKTEKVDKIFFEISEEVQY